MQRGGWLMALGCSGAWLIVIGWPVLAGLLSCLAAGPGSDAYVPLDPPAWTLGVTAAHALAVAALAVLVGWIPGRLLQSCSRRHFRFIGVLFLLPLCLPASVLFTSWWQSWPADSLLHAWAVRYHCIPLLREGTLLLGLTSWSWPVVAWCVASARSSETGGWDDLARMDGPRGRQRVLLALQRDGRGLAVGFFLVSVLTFGNTTCFDLAQVFSWGNELRARAAMGQLPSEVLRASLLPVMLALLAAWLLWRVLGRTRSMGGHPSRRPSRSTWWISGTAWLLLALVPMGMMLIRGLGGRSTALFIDLYREQVWMDLGRAMSAGVIAAFLGASLVIVRMGRRCWIHRVLDVQAVLWLLAGLVPGTTVAMALRAAYNTQELDWIYLHPGILVIGYLARFGMLPVLLARWASEREPLALRDTRRLMGDGSFMDHIRTSGPRICAVAAASFCIVSVLSLGEMAVTAQVHPPGSAPLSLSLLNAMHYQHAEPIMAAAAGLVLVTPLVALLLLVPRGRRHRVLAAGICSILLLTGGCDREPAGPAPFKSVSMFGSNGLSPGQFSYPRCMAADWDRQRLFIIDKTARVQRFGFDGLHQHQWSMPESSNGKPTGISIAPDGRVFVADTHYYRVLIFDQDGQELNRFGGYGEGPGQFIYPTDIAFGPEGRIYVSEYGGNDRIQVFDDAGGYLFTFGRFGTGDGAFNRPQALRFNAQRTELYVADACNHRIVVLDPGGSVQRVLGGAGTSRGRFHYPYGLVLLPKGDLLVAEFGNNRVQWVDRNGASLRLLGRNGVAAGEVRYPWCVVSDGSTVFVLDSGNHRVQRMQLPPPPASRTTP